LRRLYGRRQVWQDFHGVLAGAIVTGGKVIIKDEHVVGLECVVDKIIIQHVDDSPVDGPY